MTATAIIGGQWGSEGKGVVAGALAHHFDVAVRVGGPNAGHSFYDGDDKHVMRGVPCAWINDTCDLIIGAGAVVDPELLDTELALLPAHVTITVDASAAVVTHADAHTEKRKGMFEAIGSTNEGVGEARARKMARRKIDGTAILARDWGRWHERVVIHEDTRELLSRYARSGASIMLEGTQGSGLDLNHTIEWPYATSAGTNAAGLLDQTGLAPAHLDSVFLVARTLPIRVAGNSGPMGIELDWADLVAHAGVQTPEKTTVTKRVRRISKWHDGVFDRAVRMNEPTGVFLMFADYLVPEATGTTDERVLFTEAEKQGPSPLGDFLALVDRIENEWRVPIVAFGTGGPRWSLAFRDGVGRDAHGVKWAPTER